MPPITTEFGRESTAAEVVAGIDLSGRRAIVTGGASGIGVETARALAGAGAAVTLAVRDTDAGERPPPTSPPPPATATCDVRPPRPRDRASIAAFVDALERPAAHPRQQRRA